MKKILLLITMLLTISCSYAVEYYVSGSGSDSNSGLSDSAPFLTIQKAAAMMTAGDTCLIMEGVYRESVRPSAGGAPGAPVTFANYAGASVTVTGADILALSWSLYNGSVYSAPCTEEFEQLFCGGIMMNEARWPDAQADNLVRMPRSPAGAGTDQNGIYSSALPSGSWQGGYVHILPGDGWVSFTRSIQSYSPGSHLVFDYPVAPAGIQSSSYLPRAGNYFFLFGSLAGLDSAGEWHLDNTGNLLYFWAPASADPASLEISVKKRSYAFDLSNRSHVTVRGLNIHSAAINMEDSYSCLIDNVTIKYPDYFRLYNGYDTTGGFANIMSGSYNEYRNSRISHSAGSGIVIRGAYNKVTNCLIHDVCHTATYHSGLYISGSGQYGAQTFGHEVRGNTIYDSGRFLIWTPASRGIKILHNDLYNAALLSEDIGPYDGWGLDVQDHEIAYNYVHDTNCIYASGIYLDSGCNGFLVHHNIIYDIAGTAITLNTPSQDNKVYNNTAVNVNKAFAYWGTLEQGLGDPQDQSGCKIINNLVQGASDFSADPRFPTPEHHHNGYYPVDSDFIPLPGATTAVDSGFIIPGITDGYLGAAPDIGAREYGAPVWTAGYREPTATPTQGGAPDTPSITHTITATITATPTFQPMPQETVIDMFGGNSGINELGAMWSVYGTASTVFSPSPFEASAPGAYGGAYCASVSGTVSKTLSDSYPSITLMTGLSSSMPPADMIDVSGCYGLQFAANASPGYYSVMLTANSTVNTGYNDYKRVVYLSGGWQSLRIPFTDFTQEHGWGVSVPLGTVLGSLNSIQFRTAEYPSQGNSLNRSIAVDDLIIYGCGMVSPTPTHTATVYIPASLIDDFEDAGPSNYWGGSWSTYDDNSAPNNGVSFVWPRPGSFAISAGGFESLYAARLTGTVKHEAGGYPYPFIAMYTTLGGVRDFSGCTGIRFYAKGDSLAYSIRLMPSAFVPTGYNYYKFNFSPPAAWTRYEIPFSALTQETGWGITADRTECLQNAEQLQFQTIDRPASGSQWDIDLWIDNIELYGCLTDPSATATPTAVHGNASLSLEGAYAYPSIYTPSGSAGGITFTGLTAKIKLSIYNLSGSLVFFTEEATPEGTYFWQLDPKRKKEKLSPGIYIYILSNPQGEIKKGKIAIVR